MDKKDFLNQLADILEVDAVNESDELEKFECWDSLTILSIIALVSETYGKQLSNDEIRRAKTVEGILDLIQSK